MTPDPTTEAALIRRAKEGDRDAMGELVHRHAGLRYGLAKLAGFRGHDAEDIASETAIVMMAAVASFDPARRVKFGTYATNLARWRMRDMGKALRLIPLPRSSTRQPASERTRTRAEAATRGIRSLSGVFGRLLAGESDTFAEVCRREDAERARGLLALLTERERMVIRRRMDGETLDEIKVDLGVSRERVRQIEAAAMDRMRRAYQRGVA